ncbi:MAG: hypothetical protein LBE23_05835 [Vagococcus sp.]|nr:hypothetical protein [Vagococcus sp.]
MCDRFDCNENEVVSVDFAYMDEFGSTTQMSKTVESDYLGGSQLDVVCDLFKDFVLACGFTYLANKRIEWVDDKR